MFKKYVILFFVFSFIIPQLDWKIWLSMFPELKAIAQCESNFNPKAVGDHGNSYGLFQIHLPSHKGITKAQAKDPYWSLAWAIDKYSKNELNIWTCHKIITKNKGWFFNL